MLNKSIHIALAGLLFISSTGIIINKHYCQDVLKSFALFSKAEACQHGSKTISCPIHGTMEVPDDDGCCDNETDYVQSDDDRILSTQELFSQNIQVAVLAVALGQFDLLNAIESDDPHYLNYKPPLIVCDMPVVLQTFLC